MKKFLVVLFALSTAMCSAQVADDNSTENDTLDDINTDTIPFHYPYYGPRIPEYFGVVGGYEGFSTNCWEAGFVFHIGEFYSSVSANGQIAGFMITYKRSFSGRLNTIEAEVGIYTPFAIGFGFNENFYEGSRTFGFRPFIGTSLWHFQAMAGYNFYSSKQSDIAELDHFTVKIRYVLPIVRLFRKDTPNPGNNY